MSPNELRELALFLDVFPELTDKIFRVKRHPHVGALEITFHDGRQLLYFYNDKEVKIRRTQYG